MGKSTISTGPFSIAMFVYQRVWELSGQIIIIHTPEILGHFGMIPRNLTMIPGLSGLGRPGFGRDQIHPDRSGIFSEAPRVRRNQPRGAPAIGAIGAGVTCDRSRKKDECHCLVALLS